MRNSKLIVWACDNLTRIFPMDKPPEKKSNASWSMCGAKGEYCSFQVGIHTDIRLLDVEVTAAPLKKGKDKIGEKCFDVKWVGLVPVASDLFNPAGAERPNYTPGWYPDPLLEKAPWKDSEPSRSASVFVVIRIPQNARPGTYKGNLSVCVQKKSKIKIPVTLRVWPFSIPKKSDFSVTNWFHPDCVSKWHRCAPWSARYWRLLEEYAKDMAEHRINVITTPVLMGNFHNSDPMTLVDIVRKKDNTYRFDISRLDRWVKLFDKYGFKYFEMWHFLSQADGKYAPPFGLYDEKKKKNIWYSKLPSTSKEYVNLMTAFLPELSKWLSARDLTGRFLMHVFDEPKPDFWAHYAKMSLMFRTLAPGIKHLDAISKSDIITGFKADIDIPVPLTTHLEDDDGYYKKRATQGVKPVWWYTCCGPTGRYANRFLSMPLINGRMLFWQSYVFNVSGYLHWGYNFWHRTNQQESGVPGITLYADHTLVNPYREQPDQWAAGDACIVYPHPRWWEDHGPMGSLRYEALRAGLQDYEMLSLLDKLLLNLSAKPGSKKARAIKDGKLLLETVRGSFAGSLTKFSRNNRQMLDLKQKIGDCISRLC
ncbi:MAG: hypothetical protein A2231_04220 [Candidatus Firestonebacteria bacterium RIFOXYA2_FULL_40_8]|nr:MAG: hypothetical protein A2231_04220 [Candidatus Firestonebacteria bacterium RIFOXYA2_FULL_40_8]